jgi:CSLREA domain-containing protein
MIAKRFRTLFRLSIPVCLLVGLLLAASGVTVRSAPAAQPIVVTTTADDFGGGIGCSLREAIQTVNTGINFGGCSGSGGIITLPAGTYTLTGAAGEDDNASGDLDIKGDLTINGADEKTTIIQAGTNTSNGVDRVLHIQGLGVTVEINDVTIRYGKAPDGVDSASDAACKGDDGGGIFNYGGILTLNDCVVAYNRTGDGGDGCTAGYYLDGAGGYGGGIFAQGILGLNDTTVMENRTGSGGDGAAGDGYSGGRGGGIYISYYMAVTLTHSIISGNDTGAGSRGGDATGDAGDGKTGGDGGGIYSRSGALTLIDSAVTGNTTGAGGDGGDATSGNGGIGGNGGGGAGICSYGESTVVAVDSVISDNQTGLGGKGGTGSGSGADGVRGSGGGLSSTGTDVTLSDSTISDNRGLSGGLHSGSGAVVTLVNSTISGNIADADGGGIYNGFLGVTLTLNNSTISGNRAYESGGGIFNGNDSTTMLTHVTITDNTADLDNNGSGDGGGVYIPTSTFIMTNTLIARNIDKGNQNPDCHGTISSGDYNLLGEDSAGCTFASQPHDQVGPTGSPLDPGIAALHDNGGPTLTHAIKANGPAGNQIPVGVNGCVLGVRDQRGVLRFPPCSIGAYEPDQAEEVYLPLVVRD